jgi:putative membrane protein
MNSAIMAFLHHLAAFTMVGTLIYEHTAFRKDITFAEARRLQRMDLVYGVSAGVVLFIGLRRGLYFLNGAPV